MIIKTIIKISYVTLLVAATSVNAAWSIKTIDNLGGTISYATKINDIGQLTGASQLPGNILEHAFITSPNGVNTIGLGSLGANSWGADINIYGRVAGGFATASNYFHPMITGPDGTGMTDLGTLGGSDAWATGINDSGRVTGTSYIADGVATRAFITGPNGDGMVDLGTLGGNWSTANDINNQGQIVGSSTTEFSYNSSAFITGPDGVAMTNLGTLPGFLSSAAIGINNLGNVIGFSSIPSSEDYTQAFVTGPNGEGMATLGTLGGNVAVPQDINDSGQIVGISKVDSGAFHSFLFVDGGMVDLSILDVVISAGWTELLVTGINNNGQIVGSGKLSSDPGHDHPFLLSFTPDTVFNPNPIFIPAIPFPVPVPEPSTYAMLLAGLGLLGFATRHKTD